MGSRMTQRTGSSVFATPGAAKVGDVLSAAQDQLLVVDTALSTTQGTACPCATAQRCAVAVVWFSCVGVRRAVGPSPRAVESKVC